MKRRSGFTLIEIMLALSLASVFALVAFRLVNANFHTTESVMHANSSTARFDHAVLALRADVADATSIEMPQQNLLRIHRPTNATVDWQINGNLLTQTSGTEHHSWDAGQPLVLKQDGAVVLLSTGTDEPIAMAPLSNGGPR